MFTPLPFCVYVLFSEKDNMLYTGYTSDLNRRMQQHLNGESPNTSKRLPVKLIFCEYYLFKEDAERRENYFKTTAGKKALKIMLNGTLEKLKNGFTNNL
ncbi:MAG TPA: GIY-YIG nuclease family protein [Chitinophagales bacterium]|nr:GIY-YIG nuclease family protein [Chitinophagales bacterium]HRG84548.1 GIY-YIG nuclease family protein [Chitinophagales bacterium]HRH53378.1 GIY-YIG nuclease family protein [Chitinophagales bacterium]